MDLYRISGEKVDLGDSAEMNEHIADNYPKMQGGERMCSDHHCGYICNRSLGHEDFHVAYGQNPREPIAVWLTAEIV